VFDWTVNGVPNHNTSTSRPYANAPTQAAVATSAMASRASGLMRSNRRTNLSMIATPTLPLPPPGLELSHLRGPSDLMASTFLGVRLD